MSQTLIPFCVADRPISMSIIKGVSLATGMKIGILSQAATTSAQFKKLFGSYPYLCVRRFLAAQAARFAQFFRVCVISRSSASFAELGSIVAFSIARRNTWIMWRNDHSLSQSPIRPRNSSASADA